MAHSDHPWAVLSPSKLSTSETGLLIFSSDPFPSHLSHLRDGHSRLSRPSDQNPPLTLTFLLSPAFNLSENSVVSSKYIQDTTISVHFSATTPVWATITPVPWVTAKSPVRLPPSALAPSSLFSTQQPEWSLKVGSQFTSLLCWERYNGSLVHPREKTKCFQKSTGPCRTRLPPSFCDGVLSTPRPQTHWLPSCPSVLTICPPLGRECLLQIVPHALHLLCSNITLDDINVPEKNTGHHLNFHFR